MDDFQTGIASLVDLSSTRALVTGAAKGIGGAAASRLAEAGAHVTLADLDPAVQHTADALRARGLAVDHVICDITSADQVAHAVAVAAGDDDLHLLVNNAGIFPTTGPIDEVSDEFVARMLDVNVRAQYSVARDASRLMRSGGAIVNVASIAAVRGGANITAYATSKAAVVGLTKSFANELGRRGIRVNAVAPGIIDTPGVQAQLAPLKAGGLDIESAIAANPLRIAGQPDHIARAVLFLCSPLSAFVTGHLLVVDGGATA